MYFWNNSWLSPGFGTATEGYFGWCIWSTLCWHLWCCSEARWTTLSCQNAGNSGCQADGQEHQERPERGSEVEQEKNEFSPIPSWSTYKKCWQYAHLIVQQRVWIKDSGLHPVTEMAINLPDRLNEVTRDYKNEKNTWYKKKKWEQKCSFRIKSVWRSVMLCYLNSALVSPSFSSSLSAFHLSDKILCLLPHSLTFFLCFAINSMNTVSGSGLHTRISCILFLKNHF